MVDCKQKITTCFRKLAVLIYKKGKNRKRKGVQPANRPPLSALQDRYFSVTETFKASLESGTNCHCSSYYTFLQTTRATHQSPNNDFLLTTGMKIWDAIPLSLPPPPLLGITLNPSWRLLNCSIPIPKVSIALTVSSEYLFTDLRLNSLIPRKDQYLISHKSITLNQTLTSRQSRQPKRHLIV